MSVAKPSGLSRAIFAIAKISSAKAKKISAGEEWRPRYRSLIIPNSHDLPGYFGTPERPDLPRLRLRLSSMKTIHPREFVQNLTPGRHAPVFERDKRDPHARIPRSNPITEQMRKNVLAVLQPLLLLRSQPPAMSAKRTYLLSGLSCSTSIGGAPTAATSG